MSKVKKQMKKMFLQEVIVTRKQSMGKILFIEIFISKKIIPPSQSLFMAKEGIESQHKLVEIRENQSLIDHRLLEQA